MIVEILIAGASLIGCGGCWVAVQKHKINAEMQKEKLKHDLEVFRGPTEPPAPEEEPTPDQQALTALLHRRATLESNITDLREKCTQFSQYGEGKRYDMARADSLKALEDARKEQQEVIIEQEKLLKSMRGTHEDAPTKPVRVDTGGPVAERVEDPDLVYDVELHDEETSRKGAA